MRRRNPWGPQPLSEYPSVRFAVRAWALHQCISAVVVGGLILYFVVRAFTQAVIVPAPPRELEGSEDQSGGRPADVLVQTDSATQRLGLH
jgi:hypothetical protein